MPDTSSPIYQQQVAENNKINARARLNSIFQDPAALAARQKMYGDTATAARDLNMKYLTEDRDQAAQQQKYAALRSGLAGGSADLDENAKLARTFNQGVVDIGNQTDAMKRSLEGADEEARLQLLDQINQGMDEQAAATQAAARISNNASQAVANTRGRMVGDLFSNFGQFGGAAGDAMGRASVAGSVPLPAGYTGMAGAAARRRRTFSY